MAANDSDYAISRLDLDQAGTHGWQVRPQRKGVRFARFFADSTWGGRRRALEMARQFRDRIVARMDRAGTGAVRVQEQPTSRNQSGVIGVSRVTHIGANGSRYHFWQANWSKGAGVRKSVRFSILQHGEETAFELACEARREGISRKD